MSFEILEIGRHALDVVLVSVVIYYLILLIRGTRAVQITLGIILVVGIYYFADVGGLITLKKTLETFFTVLPVAIIVLFQDEIRRAFAQVGRQRLWSGAMDDARQLDEVLREVILACSALSSRSTGALIVIERLDGLKNYVDNGVVLDSKVSHDLLISLFNTDVPLHDGAIIIQGDRLAAAGCFLPLTLNRQLSRDYGTRHRAALGISEQSDAAAVVVSEETGIISLAYAGKIERNFEPDELHAKLYQVLISDVYAQVGGTS